MKAETDREAQNKSTNLVKKSTRIWQHPGLGYNLPTDRKTPRGDKEGSNKCAQIKVRLLRPELLLHTQQAQQTTTITISQDPPTFFLFLTYDPIPLTLRKLELPWMLESVWGRMAMAWAWGGMHIHTWNFLASPIQKQKSKRHGYGPTCFKSYLPIGTHHSFTTLPGMHLDFHN